MNIFSELFEKKNIGQLILSILFLIYLIIGYKMPYDISNFINNGLGMLLVILITIVLVFRCNPIVGILSILVAYTLIQRSKDYINTSYQMGLNSLAQYEPKEKYIYSPFTPTHQFPITLEQEIVEKIAPICNSNSVLPKASFTPYLENTYDSAPI